MQPRVQKRKLPPTVTTKDPRRRAQNQPPSEPPTKIVPLSVPRSSGSLSGFKREVKPEMPASGSGEGRSQWEGFGASRASSSTDVFSSTSRPKSEWKTEEKPQLSLFTAVLTELRVAAGCQDVSSMLEIIARINSIYLNRLQHREAMEAISVFSEIFSGKTIRGLLSVGAELIQIARTIFIKFDMTRAVAEKFFASVSNVSIRECYSLYSLVETLLISKKLPVDQITHVFEEAKLSLVKEEGKLRLGAAKLLIAYLQRCDDKSEKSSLCTYLLDYCGDRNGVIRRIIIEGLEVFFNAEKMVPLDAYDLFTQLTEDSDKFVRLASLRIVRLYAEHYKANEISQNRNFPLRMIDDAFTVVCHAMNDLDIEVRAEAAKVLGTFENVSDKFLFQTLDKKIMRNMKRLSDGRILGGTGGGNEWSTGKTLGEDIPAEAEEDDAQSIIPTGACGAFVTALEDEFQAVRLPAVYSLGRLAANRPAFANACIDHLADMFNDEIANVRISAIRALTPLVSHGILDLEQLKTLLTGLDDASQDSRVALHELLGKANFTHTDCVRDLLLRLIDSVKRFEEDKMHVFKCISNVGLRHAHLVGDIVGEVFRLHPILQRVEQPITDDDYLAKLILCLNAASRSAPLVALLPDHVRKHYRFLRIAMPHLVMPVTELDEERTSTIDLTTSLRLPDADINTIIGREYERLKSLQHADLASRGEEYKRFLNSLEFFLNVEPEYANASNYLYVLGSVTFVVHKVMKAIRTGVVPVSLDIQEAIEKITFLQRCFKGVDKAVLAFLLECSIHMSVVYAFVQLSNDPKFMPNAVALFGDELRRANKRLVELDVEPSPALRSFLRFLVEASKPKKPGFTGTFSIDIFAQSDLSLSVEQRCFRSIAIKSIKIVQPREVKKHTMIIGLPSGVPVNCILNNFTDEDIANFRVKIKYVDDTSAYFLPPKSDFTKIADNQWRVITHVLVLAMEGLASLSDVHFTFGLLHPRSTSPAPMFYDRCTAFTPSIRMSANAQGLFVALPNTDDLKNPATCAVQIEPKQVRTAG
uniref:Integrator complex subunit 4 n=1 Tax=Panagrellus redivivus TaxID=6233 RepID=A0A7E5A2F1_PANRE